MGSEDGSYFTILTLSIYTVKRNWVESSKSSRWNSQQKAQFTLLFRDLRFMSRHGFPFIPHVQSRPFVAFVATKFLAAAWINGRDIVYGRDLVR